MEDNDTTFEGANSSLVAARSHDNGADGDVSSFLSPHSNGKRQHHSHKRPTAAAEDSSDDVTHINNSNNSDDSNNGVDRRTVRFSGSTLGHNQHLRTDGSEEDMRQSTREAALAKHGVFGHAFGEAHDQLDHFFENSMLDLRRREIEIEGIVLLSKRRLMAMSKEAYLAGEADQKRVDLLASQKKKSELLLGHETEAKRQRQDAAAKKEALFVEASASKARSLKMQQLQETHELALALNQGAGARAPAFAREVAFLQRQQNEQREFIKEIQSRRALNLELRQAAVRSTKKDIDARFLKREQDREKQNLKEFGEREGEKHKEHQKNLKRIYVDFFFFVN